MVYKHFLTFMTLCQKASSLATILHASSTCVVRQLRKFQSYQNVLKQHIPSFREAKTFGANEYNDPKWIDPELRAPKGGAGSWTSLTALIAAYHNELRTLTLILMTTSNVHPKNRAPDIKWDLEDKF